MEIKKDELTIANGKLLVSHQGCEICLSVESLFPVLKNAFAEKHLRETWEEMGLPGDRINALLEDETMVPRWICALENNECILECIRLSAELMAAEKTETEDK